MALVACAGGTDDAEAAVVMGCDRGGVASAVGSVGEGASDRGCEGSALGGMADAFSLLPGAGDKAVG